MSRRVLVIGAILALGVVALLLWKSKDSDTATGQNAKASNSQGGDAPAESGANPSLVTPTRLGSPGSNTTAMAGTVRGTVVDAVSGQPVPFVDIVFRKRNEESAATSDDDGRYEAELAAGQYEIRAIGEGVIAKALPELRMGSAPQVSLDIPVTRLATLRGKVVDPTGRSLADVEILLRNDTPSSKDFPHRGEIGVTTSMSDGSFELAVPPGSVDLEAKLELTTVFATVPKVEAGATREGIEIVMDRRGVIRGSVTGPDGGPAVGAQVLLSYRREGTSQFESRAFTTDSGGNFLASELAPQAYILEATHPDFAPSGPQQAVLSPQLLELAAELQLSTPASISGRVVDSEGRPVGNAQVAQVWEDSKQRFAKMETYADGLFRFDGLGVGPHRIRARKEGYADTLHKGVSAPTEELVLVLVALGGIEGTVKDSEGKPATVFTLMYRKTDSKKWDSSEYRTVDGSFQLYPVEPGSYTVRVTAKGASPSENQELEVPSGGYGKTSFVLGGK